VIRLLSYFVAAFGVICALIGLMHVILGPAAVPEGLVYNATMDSEHRFYTSLFVGFGAAMFWCSQDLHVRRGPFFALLAMFFLGGLARIVSLFAAGPPHMMFQILGAVELVLPIILWAWHRRAFGR
jgi:hypothetical protein